MAESGCKRFHRAGHLSFMSNESSEYKVLHEGGTLKVRVYGGAGGTGTLNPHQRKHWAAFLKEHQLEHCDECNGVKIHCKHHGEHHHE